MDQDSKMIFEKARDNETLTMTRNLGNQNEKRKRKVVINKLVKNLENRSQSMNSTEFLPNSKIIKNKEPLTSIEVPIIKVPKNNKQSFSRNRIMNRNQSLPNELIQTKMKLSSIKGMLYSTKQKDQQAIREHIEKVGTKVKFGRGSIKDLTHDNLHDLVNSYRYLHEEQNTDSLLPGSERFIQRASSIILKPSVTKKKQTQESPEIILPVITKSQSTVEIGQEKLLESLKCSAAIDDWEEKEEENSVIALTRFFNDSSIKYNSFPIKVDTLLYKMSLQEDLSQKPPYLSQTVLASSILWKLATSILPRFKKVLIPVANYLFKAIYIGFYDLGEAEEDENKLNPDLFLPFQTWYQSHRQLKNERHLLRKQLSKQKQDVQGNSATTIIRLFSKLKQYQNKDIIRKCFIAIQQESTKGKLGDLKIQQDFIKKKKVLCEQRKDFQITFEKWKCFVKEQQLQRERQNTTQTVERELDTKNQLSSMTLRIERAEMQIEQLKSTIKQRDYLVKKLIEETEQQKEQINKITPQTVGFFLSNYQKYYQEVPSVKRIDAFNPDKFIQLSGVFFNPLVDFILNPTVGDKKKPHIRQRRHSLIQMSAEQIKGMNVRLRRNWYLQNLLEPQEVPKGVALLNNCSMDNVLMRWVFFMIKTMLSKLRPVIEILEDQLVNKNHKKKHSRLNWLLPTDATTPKKRKISSSSSESQPDYFTQKQQKLQLEKQNIYKKQNIVLAQEALNGQTLSSYMDNLKVGKELIIDEAVNLYALLKRLYCDLKTPYSEWQSRRNASVSIDLPSLLLAIVFSIDHSYKFVKLNTQLNNSAVWTEMVPESSIKQKPSSNKQTNVQSEINREKSLKILEKMFKIQQTSKIHHKDQQFIFQIPDLSMIVQFYSIFENQKNKNAISRIQEDKEQKTGILRRIPTNNGQINQLQNMGNYQKDHDQFKEIEQANFTINQFIFLIKEIQRVIKVDVSSILSPNDLLAIPQTISCDFTVLQGVPDTSLSTLLSFLFLYKSRLDEPVAWQKKEVEQVDDQTVSNNLFEKLVTNVFQIVHPVVQTAINSYFQDITLLSYAEEKTKDVENKSVKELKLRWVNYVLERAYSAMRTKEKETTFQTSSNPQKYLGNLLDYQKVTDLESLIKNKNNQLIVLLATLSPESVWRFFHIDQLPISHNIDLLMLIVALLEPLHSACARLVRGNLAQTRSTQMGFLQQSSLMHEFRCLFVHDAVLRITNKGWLGEYDQLVKGTMSKANLDELVSELFIARPSLNTYGTGQLHRHVNLIKHFTNSQAEFLSGQFDKRKMDMLPQVIEQMVDQHANILEALQYVSDCEQAFQTVCKKFKEDQAASRVGVAKHFQRKLENANVYYQRMEKSVTNIDQQLIGHFINFKSKADAENWCQKAQEVIQTFKQPIISFMKKVTNDFCQVSYQQFWHIIKEFNLVGLNSVNKLKYQLKTKKVEFLLTKVAIFVQRRNSNNQAVQSAVDMVSFDQDFNKKVMKSLSPEKSETNLEFEQMMLRRVSIKAGIANQAVKIKSSLLPKQIAQQDAFVERRLLYDLSLSVNEVIAVILVLVFDMNLSEILEFFFQGVPEAIQKPKPGVYPTKLLILSPNEPLNFKKEQQNIYKQFNLQLLILEKTTNQSLEQHKTALSFMHGQEKDLKLLGSICDAMEESPKPFMTLMLTKCLLQRSEKNLENTQKRLSLMNQKSIQTVLNFYKPLLITLFEFYLYESYRNDQLTQLQESCIPLSAFTDFYLEFAISQSPRLNKSTQQDMLMRVFEHNPAVFITKEEKPVVDSKKRGLKVEEVTVTSGVVNYQDFLEIIFEISQEINVNQNVTIEQKLKEYIDKVIILGIRYRICQKNPSSDLHQKRLLSELDLVRATSQIRTAGKYTDII